MSGAFEIKSTDAAENFAELAEELLLRSLETTATNAAGKIEDKSLALQQLEAQQSYAAVQLAQFHAFYQRPSEMQMPSFEQHDASERFAPDGD